jgi:hypothetical protein
VIKKVLVFAKRSIIFLIITFILFEIGLRVFGYGPFELPKFSMESSPNRHLLPDDQLGVRLNPGHYKVTLNKYLRYTATHLPNGYRTCGESKVDGPLIAFYGCSFTYGTGVNDEDVYPYIIQKKFDSLYIENRAVPGFGQAQMLLNLEQELSKPIKPAVIVLNYLSFHNERNTLNTSYRQKLRIGYEITKRDDAGVKQFKCSYPYGKMVNGKLELDQLSMEEIKSTLPLITYSSVMNWFQNLCDQSSVDTNEDEKVTLALIDQIERICKKNGVKLIISTMSNDEVTKRFIQHCESRSISTIDISVDFTKKGYNNKPFDQHPSALAHKKIAEKLAVFLKTII